MHIACTWCGKTVTQPIYPHPPVTSHLTKITEEDSLCDLCKQQYETLKAYLTVLNIDEASFVMARVSTIVKDVANRYGYNTREWDFT